ncbi:uncharacterized protein V1518DRAFT_413457 [Limtongia smithiae]|uniref:uncharacterized protein n=1 Tax=Limtongia smithiae TaxID=1125753 RepID=UPI0034CFF562
MRLQFTSTAAALLCAASTALAQDYELLVSVESLSPTFRYADSVPFSIDAATKHATIYKEALEARSPVPTIEVDVLILVNGNSLSDHIPLSTAAEVQDVFTINTDSTGVPFHVDYTYKTIISESSRSNGPIAPEVKVIAPVRGPAAFLRPVVLREAAPEEEKTFLQKYWLFLVPMLLVFMLGGGGGGS